MDYDNLPTPMTGSLDDLLEASDGVDEKQHKVFVGHNLGHRVFLLQVPMHEFYKISEVANEQACDGLAVAQRKLDPTHAQKLAKYILKGLISSAINHIEAQKKPAIPMLSDILARMGKQPYMSLQPLVANIRDIGVLGRNLRAERILAKDDSTGVGFRIFLSQRNVLWVVDGQHRREAMKMVFDFLDYVQRNRSYPKKGSLFEYQTIEVSNEELLAWQAALASARSFSTVTVEVHLGLEPEQERQLFHDLNNLGKKIDKNLALKFDNSNPINLFIKETLMGDLNMNIIEKDVRDWKDDEGGLSLKDAVSINSILFLNKTNISGAAPAIVNERSSKAKDFWFAVNAIPGFGEAGAKMTTVVAQPVMLKALAKLVYDFNFSARKPDNSDELSTKLLNAITDIDFSHENPMWRYYELDEAERSKLVGLSDYLPSDESGNRDLGAYQNGVMRFGAKHNDIFPLLGDIIRWKLSLPNRHIK